MRLKVKANGQFDARDSNGDTSAMLAEKAGHLNVAELL